MTEQALRYDLLSHPGDTALILGPCILFLFIAYLDYRSRRKPNRFIRRVLAWLVKMFLRLIMIGMVLGLIFGLKVPAFVTGILAEYYAPLGMARVILVVAGTALVVLMTRFCILYIRAGMR